MARRAAAEGLDIAVAVEANHAALLTSARAGVPDGLVEFRLGPLRTLLGAFHQVTRLGPRSGQNLGKVLCEWSAAIITRALARPDRRGVLAALVLRSAEADGEGEATLGQRPVGNHACQPTVAVHKGVHSRQARVHCSSEPGHVHITPITQAVDGRTEPVEGGRDAGGWGEYNGPAPRIA